MHWMMKMKKRRTKKKLPLGNDMLNVRKSNAKSKKLSKRMKLKQANLLNAKLMLSAQSQKAL